MAEWTEYTVADVILTVIDYRGKTPKKLGGDWSESGYRALSAKNIKTGKIVQEDSIRYVSEKMYRCWMKEEIQKGDILITSEAPFGQIYYWDSYEKIVLSQRLFALRVNNTFYPKYIYFYMISSLFQAELDCRATGTTVVGLRQPELLKCKICAPDYQEQKRIADTLWSIEQKINNNEMINNNLEQQAQAYFDKLFVVNADPNWPECTLSDIGSVIAGGTPSKSKPEYYADQGIAWITPKDLSVDKSKFISRGENDISELGFSKSSATKMPAGTILFSSRAPIGYIAIAQNEVTTNQGFKSVIPNENIGTAYVYFLLKNLLPTIEGMASGSTFKEISGAAMRSVPTVIPDADTIQLFSNLCEPIFKEQEVLESENKYLSALRDTLLQKLMSGELDVSDMDL